MNTIAKRNRRSGMTLVEIMIATVVFVIGFSGIMATSTYVFGVVRAAREETQAIAAAQHVLEIVKTYSWVRLSLMVGESPFDIADNAVATSLRHPSCTVSVQEVPSELERMRLVSAKIRWQEKNGNFAERELASYIARKKRLR